MEESEAGSGNFIAPLTILAVAVLAGYFWFIQGPEPMFPDRSCGNSCINNLRQIDGAIQQWALENKMGTNAAVKYSDITPYLKNPIVCPAGGVYKIGLVADLPTCSIKGHELPK